MYPIVKRSADLFVACIALVILCPLVVTLFFANRFIFGKPVLFNQKRPGRAQQIFMMHKFRTMTNDKDDEGNLLPDEERLTSWGKFLRSSSLDELPELWNVIRGDMSFVGPRPLLVQYLPLYSPFQNRRHEVRPGITGLAQISGRNNLSWPEKFAIDVEYVDNMSLKLDLWILWKTFIVTFKREGISHGADVTMPIFQGER